MNFLSQNKDPLQHKILYRYNPLSVESVDIGESSDNTIDDYYVKVEELKYRKTDKTLIIVIKEKMKVIITTSLILINIL